MPKEKLNKMGAIKIINGKLVNEGCIEQKDILIYEDRIEKINEISNKSILFYPCNSNINTLINVDKLLIYIAYSHSMISHS